MKISIPSRVIHEHRFTGKLLKYLIVKTIQLEFIKQLFICMRKFIKVL